MLNKICFVVHRYAPYAGGSEYYVQAMAEEFLRRGYAVTVLTGTHAGDCNGVRVTNDLNILASEQFDLVVVHGADVWVQDAVLLNADKVISPIMYMIILPSTSQVAMRGMSKSAYLAHSTVDDLNHITKFGHSAKAVPVRHSIPSKLEDSLGQKGVFRKKYGVTTPYLIVSCGGYWANKGMDELADTFRDVFKDRQDTTLVFTGYANKENAPMQSEYVKTFVFNDRQDSLDAIADADLYILNSTSEGFGLVLLEAMLNETPWAARNIAGATQLKEYGYTYNNNAELREFLTNFPVSLAAISKYSLYERAEYVRKERSIKDTCDDIEKVLKQ